jgi:hypothetical protein
MYEPFREKIVEYAKLRQVIGYALANTFFLYYLVRELDMWSGFIDAEVA